MNKYGIAEVINQFRHRMDEAGFTSRQKTVMTHLCQCHTPVMGGRLKACDHCGHSPFLCPECKEGMMGVVEVYSPIRDGPFREKAA
jgi:hypothetical protein